MENMKLELCLVDGAMLVNIMSTTFANLRIAQYIVSKDNVKLAFVGDYQTWWSNMDGFWKLTNDIKNIIKNYGVNEESVMKITEECQLQNTNVIQIGIDIL